MAKITYLGEVYRVEDGEVFGGSQSDFLQQLTSLFDIGAHVPARDELLAQSLSEFVGSPYKPATESRRREKPRIY